MLLAQSALPAMITLDDDRPQGLDKPRAALVRSNSDVSRAVM